MPDRMIRFYLAALFASCLLFVPQTTHAQETEPQVSADYNNRASQLLGILKGSGKEESFFAASFLKAVPVAQFRGVTAQLTAQYGDPIDIARIIPATEYDGTVEIRFERAIVAIRMVLDRTAPHPVVGLLVTGVQVTGDDMSAIKQEFDTLPGHAGFEVAEITGGQYKFIAGHNQSRQFAIGSVFKLYVLAELARSIKSGERDWSDIIPLGHKSLPSGILQNWPDDTPLTLQSLATLMISISDNTATDILIRTVGRENIDKMVRTSGHRNPAKIIPVLTTLEAFALKMPVNDDLRRKYTSASDSAQSALLNSQQTRLDRDDVKVANLATVPRHIEQVEWFAAPADISKLLSVLNIGADPVIKNIMAINTVIPPGDAKRWLSLGAKGGSEPGVVSFAFLVVSKTGEIFSVSGSWNNPTLPVQDARFLTLMNRLLNITASR